MKKAALHNLGCKVNAYETEAMQELLENRGYEIVPFKEKADIYIINTCTVTNMADRKSRQMLHKAKKMNPEALVVAAGCYVQVEENHKDILESVDVIIGNNKKNELVEIIESYEKQQVNTIDINHTNQYENLHVSKTADHTRAYLKVQDGCNQFCSYCIIPFARGRVRSRDKEEVVAEVKTLASNGYKEIVLTGIHLSSYGVDLENENLLSLLMAVHQVDGIERIRLGSLEPRIITEEFVKTISNMPKMCPHFHLSLQSGCDETLKRMNRRYSADEYREACKILRRYFEEPSLTTDVIVGFPGETEEEFQSSRNFVEEIGFFETHIFKYSKRKGTKAADMENQVSDEIKAVRSNELIKLNDVQQKKHVEKMYGRCVSVLLEEKVEEAGKSYMLGHTKEYIKVSVLAGELSENTIIERTIGDDLQIVH